MERQLKEKYEDEIAFSNWSDEKKMCAKELWNRFYVEGGYDAYFVAGLIGNMYGEANVGQLQMKDWSGITDEDGIAVCKSGEIISNIHQAEVACLKAGEDFGVGMMQWSQKGRKEHLFDNYKIYQSGNGTLSVAKMIEAECKTVKEELEGDFKVDVCDRYQDLVQEKNYEGDTISLATCVLFRHYEIPEGYKNVDFATCEIIDGIWERAEEKDNFNDIPSICKRVIAAKIAYEEFMGTGET